MSDSFIIGDLLGDLVGGDDDDMGDLIGDAELGRRVRRGLKRRAKRAGFSSPSSQASAARVRQLQATNQEANEERTQLTAGHYVADSGQRELYLPFQASVAIAAAAGSTATLAVPVQRPCSFYRLILTQHNGTTLADDAITSAVSGFFIGVDPIFNAAGVAPLQAFAFNAVGNRLMTPVARVGSVVTVQVTRVTAGANAGVLMGYLVGVSAER